ncbi:Threonine/homoserine/homoserine lactone efflux protein [Streptomyces sp. 2224.1]|uniref:LysE family translocator n=1 Tax=unclassified Streptomyces TaxID=2593676 RepID=UPI0008908F65|nr:MULTISPECIES: LysE family transporter [unclassified Streptomyces]PBC86730.1 threonine/homoserine/homoserine lactone efflux protein [Streptomyces sp. 2321.6]SDQ74255.1 Threonine/homoserine/homoserine lactone efflux protein [Streptomyces sp. KS_16]SED47538.1 Threonine/homoserine/homoserine lactone efflux protein [Streptomyces sp. 2112.3]SED83290.1 Threonine/homoserine/homoserine lactone efflux protein [Streptomyces sp. 2224.1]SEE07682.1 Threonine/homoserine/homoserine lactone efflux protein [
MDGQLITFTGVAAGMVAMPGADFAVVVRNALDSRRAGVAAAVGVAGGLLVHTALAVAGLAAVLVAVPALFGAVQLLGGGYLLYLGTHALIAAVRRPAATTDGTARTAAGTPADGRPHAAALDTTRSLRQGFLTNALNPKAPVLFLSLLPQFVPAGAPALPRTLLLAAMVVAMALVWFPAVALLVDRLGVWLRRPSVARALEATTGALLTTLGGILLVELALS